MHGLSVIMGVLEVERESTEFAGKPLALFSLIL